jgi:CheY-like chemotaxis protein
MNLSETPLKILVAEDNDINQEVVQGILERAGLHVTLAQDGFAALAALEKETFHAVLMDIQMPRMDGFEATRRIRQNPAWQNIPILAMTASGVGEIRDVLASGMNDHVVKPFTTEELIEALRRWITF